MPTSEHARSRDNGAAANTRRGHLRLLAAPGTTGLRRVGPAAGYPGSGMVPATSALLNLLALKLIDKERRSHISDFNFDEAMGLFAGLNVLPKATFATDYSYRTVRENQQRLLAGWVSQLLPRLDPEPNAFSLDFHSIPHRGEDNGLENHYVPMRGKAVPSVLTFFAQAVKSRLLCYSDATVGRKQAAGQLLRSSSSSVSRSWRGPRVGLLRFEVHDVCRDEPRQRPWEDLIHHHPTPGQSNPPWPRRRPASSWRRAVIDTPKRRHRNIRYIEQTIHVADYEGICDRSRSPAWDARNPRSS